MTDLVWLLLAFIVGVGVGVVFTRNGLSQMLRETASSQRRLVFGDRIYRIIQEHTLKRD